MAGVQRVYIPGHGGGSHRLRPAHRQLDLARPTALDKDSGFVSSVLARSGVAVILHWAQASRSPIRRRASDSHRCSTERPTSLRGRGMASWRATRASGGSRNDQAGTASRVRRIPSTSSLSLDSWSRLLDCRQILVARRSLDSSVRPRRLRLVGGLTGRRRSGSAAHAFLRLHAEPRGRLLRQGSARDLDPSCVGGLRRPPFVTEPAARPEP